MDYSPTVMTEGLLDKNQRVVRFCRSQMADNAGDSYPMPTCPMPETKQSHCFDGSLSKLGQGMPRPDGAPNPFRGIVNAMMWAMRAG